MAITTAMVKELWQATGAGLLDCKKALEAHGGDLNRAAEYLRQKGLAKAAEKSSRETKAGLVVVQAAGDTVCAIHMESETDFVARTEDFRTLVHRAADQVMADPGLTDEGKLLAANFVDEPDKTTAGVIQGLISRLGENIVVRHAARYTAGQTSLVEGYVHAGEIEGYGPMEGRIGVLLEVEVGGAAGTEAAWRLSHDLILQIAAEAPRYVAAADVPDEVAQAERAGLLAELAGENKPEPIKAKIVEGRLHKFYEQVCLLEQAFVKDDSITVDELLRQKSAELGTPVSVKRFARFEVGA